MITVKLIKGSDFEVLVESKSTTQHKVHVSNGFYKLLTDGKFSYENLIKVSFEFLLERESNNSILSQFDLKVISHYFPEYEKEIKKRLKDLQAQPSERETEARRFAKEVGREIALLQGRLAGEQKRADAAEAKKIVDFRGED